MQLPKMAAGKSSEPKLWRKNRAVPIASCVATTVGSFCNRVRPTRTTNTGCISNQYIPVLNNLLHQALYKWRFSESFRMKMNAGTPPALTTIRPKCRCHTVYHNV